MGSKPVPNYANIFVSKIDKKIEAHAEEDKAAFLALLKRFLDDFFLLYFGSSRKLHDLFEKTSLLRRLQAQILPDATPPIGQINAFSKMAVTFEPLKGF